MRCLALVLLLLLTGCRTILDIIGSKKQRVVIEEKERLDFPAFSRAWTIPDIEMAFAPIESGKFIMGSLNQIDRNSNPWHYVTLSKPFWMSRYEVTQEQYTRVVEYNPARFIGDHKPVEQVIWRDAEKFCMILTVLETKNNRIPDGYIYRLPTEAEWEFCCRAGTEADYPGRLISVAWYNVNSGTTSHDVGIKEPNALGIFDMLGNVAEWCHDRGGIYSEESVVDPKGPEVGTSRIIRGGSWYNSTNFCTSRYRYFMNEDNANEFVGFRVVLAPGKLDFINVGRVHKNVN